MTRFKPLNNYIQIEPIMPEQSHKGIILAGSAQPQPTRGVVVAVGPGKVRDDLTLAPMPAVTPGDTVMFTAGSLKAVKTLDGVAFLIEAETLLGVEIRTEA